MAKGDDSHTAAGCWAIDMLNQNLWSSTSKFSATSAADDPQTCWIKSVTLCLSRAFVLVLVLVAPAQQVL